jgi:hypothetical protein
MTGVERRRLAAPLTTEVMNLPQNYKLDRSVLETAHLTSKSNDRQYWLSKTPDKRFEALEILRQISLRLRSGYRTTSASF